MHGMNNIKFTGVQKQVRFTSTYQSEGNVCGFCWSRVVSLISVMRGMNNTIFIANELLLVYLNVNESESSINN